MCTCQPGFYVAFVNYYIILVQNILIPLLMIILGIWAVKNLRKRRQVTVVTITTVTVAVHPNHSKDSQLIRILMIDVGIYIVFNAMLPPALIYLQILQARSAAFTELELGSLLLNVALFSSYIPFLVGFYTNFLMSKTFRYEVKNIIKR
ncbi:unnamed protein product [Adineta steineri]|uniref:G-protein coupled receptors family 1 profile domain-containing protein n=1 Tax=Adineta steineri TaxID=433720 RepID=A0A814HIF2_9BILA|nr:unnamed protein product [Adineta steineri]CAF3778403.1 unnamed protein product [Adineta steineri]